MTTFGVIAEVAVFVMLVGMALYLRMNRTLKIRALGFKSDEERAQELDEVVQWRSGSACPRHAILALMPGEQFCGAACKALTQRFEPGEEPELPLPKCTAPLDCSCEFQRVLERRRGPRRLEDRPSSELGFEDRRSGEDRRG